MTSCSAFLWTVWNGNLFLGKAPINLLCSFVDTFIKKLSILVLKFYRRWRIISLLNRFRSYGLGLSSSRCAAWLSQHWKVISDFPLSPCSRHLSLSKTDNNEVKSKIFFDLRGPCWAGIEVKHQITVQWVSICTQSSVELTEIACCILIGIQRGSPAPGTFAFWEKGI